MKKLKKVHPISAYLIALVCGILAKAAQIKLLIAFLIIFFILTLVVSVIRKANRKSLFFICYLVIFFIFGYQRFGRCIQKFIRISQDSSIAQNYIAEVLDIIKHGHNYFNQKILLNLHRKDINANFTAYVYVPKTIKMEIGTILKIENLKLKYPDQILFNYAYDNLIPRAFLTKFNFKVIKSAHKSIKIIISKYKNKLAQNLMKLMSAKTQNLFAYIFLGLKNKTNLIDNIRYKFSYWGIAHYLARSGLHVVIIIFAWSIFLRLIPITLCFKQILLIFLSFFYWILTWSSISFERAIITFLLVQICLILNLPIRSIYLINLCCLMFLIINPLQLFCLDFQLSFILALGISFFNEIFSKKI